MSTFFRCDQCSEICSPKDLRKVVALYPMGASIKNAMLVVDLHAGDICTSCVNAIKAVLPQEPEPVERGESDSA